MKTDVYVCVRERRQIKDSQTFKYKILEQEFGKLLTEMHGKI